MGMKMTVAVDESLLEEALRVSGSRSGEDLVQRALEEYVDHHRPHNLQEEALDIRSLRDHVGILPDYDYKSLRREES